MTKNRKRLAFLAAAPLLALGIVTPVSATIDPNPGYATSNAGVSSAMATAGPAAMNRISCYRPEVPYFTVNPYNFYSGMTACNGSANTGEDTGASGPYRTQVGSNFPYPADRPMLVKDHSESDIRSDPTHPGHLIGTSKWIISAEGYNHLLGFYESWDNGNTWPVQGHIPGYEGWTDNTDPVGAFDSNGNFYALLLPYQFFYDADGHHNFSTNPNQQPNPSLPAGVISIAIHPYKTLATQSASNWTATNFSSGPSAQLDVIASYSPRGQSPDKQWITIDTKHSPYNRAYAMWVDFTGPYTAHPLVSYADIIGIHGEHSAWSQPAPLPQAPDSPTGSTYLLPHVDPDGTVWTTMTSTPPEKKFAFADISLVKSTDSGLSWVNVGPVVRNVVAPPGQYANTNFRDGIFNSFAVGPIKAHPGDPNFPLYVPYEDYSTGYTNVMLVASYDGGATWKAPIRVNDNITPTDSFQPNAAVSANGTLAVNFYDRRLACPAQNFDVASGVSGDTWHPRYGDGVSPPYNALNYCVNASIQFYKPDLNKFSNAAHNNIRLTKNTWDPQLNAPHSGCATCSRAFIGDYFGNSFSTVGGITYSISSFVSTYGYSGNSYVLDAQGTTATHNQQQIFARLAIPTS